jgi:hypothetical protein
MSIHAAHGRFILTEGGTPEANRKDGADQKKYAADIRLDASTAGYLS